MRNVVVSFMTSLLSFLKIYRVYFHLEICFRFQEILNYGDICTNFRWVLPSLEFGQSRFFSGFLIYPEIGEASINQRAVKGRELDEEGTAVDSGGGSFNGIGPRDNHEGAGVGG